MAEYRMPIETYERWLYGTDVCAAYAEHVRQLVWMRELEAWAMSSGEWRWPWQVPKWKGYKKRDTQQSKEYPA